jgi:hypothetical protein
VNPSGRSGASTSPGGCELRFHGESYGWEAQILRNGELFAGQRFVLRRMAEAWAEAERKLLKEA